MKYCLVTFIISSSLRLARIDTEADVLTVSSASSAALRLLKNGDTKRGRGRPKLTWDESVKRDLKIQHRITLLGEKHSTM